MVEAPILESPDVSHLALKEVWDMNRDELEGKAEQIKGKVKQAAGDLTDNEELHGEGVADEAAGSVQEGLRDGPPQGRRGDRRPRRQDQEVDCRAGTGSEGPAVREPALPRIPAVSPRQKVVTQGLIPRNSGEL